MTSSEGSNRGPPEAPRGATARVLPASARVSAKTPGLASNKGSVGVGNALLEPDARTPPEVAKAAHIQELARRPVGLAEILHDLPLKAHNLGHQRGELGNGEILT